MQGRVVVRAENWIKVLSWIGITVNISGSVRHFGEFLYGDSLPISSGVVNIGLVVGITRYR